MLARAQQTEVPRFGSCSVNSARTITDISMLCFENFLLHICMAESGCFNARCASVTTYSPYLQDQRETARLLQPTLMLGWCFVHNIASHSSLCLIQCHFYFLFFVRAAQQPSSPGLRRFLFPILRIPVAERTRYGAQIGRFPNCPLTRVIQLPQSLASLRTGSNAIVIRCGFTRIRKISRF